MLGLSFTREGGGWNRRGYVRSGVVEKAGRFLWLAVSSRSFCPGNPHTLLSSPLANP